MTLSFLVWPVRSSYSVLESLGVLAVSLSVGVLSPIAAWAQTPEPSANAPQSAPAQPNAQILSDEQKENFRKKMMGIPLNHSGCFEASPANEDWKEVQCEPPPKPPSPLALRRLAVTNVGNGTDYFAQVTGGYISSATGSFDNGSATGITSVYSPIYNSSKTVVHPNTYTLQLNANRFSTSATAACAGGGGCKGWEQFLFSQRSACGKACVYIEYWLFESPSCPSQGTLGKGCSCPSAEWISYYDPSGVTASGCYINTNATGFPTPAIADLGKLKLTGAANSGGVDQVTLQTADGVLHALNYPDSTLNLAKGWTGAEFNVFGDCCAYEAFLNSGSNLTTRLSTTSANAPSCLPPNTPTTTFDGSTAETNNLQLVSGSCLPGGSPLAIVFSESGGGSLPGGYTIRRYSPDGVHYDFQASGDFVLVQADPGLLVQTRQKPVPASPVVSVNTAVGIKMQDNRVAVCLAGLSVNGSFKTLASLANGVTVSRKGSVYTVSSPSGDVVRADLSSQWVWV
jgi:hypothetical protein